jgi:acetyltransferase-like isoleucine patch superfamily enzyme
MKCSVDHPRDPVLRHEDYERSIPVGIGENVWIGSGATQDVPADAAVMGNPAGVYVREG